MDETGKVVRLRQPEEIDDPLTAILRAGARRLLLLPVLCLRGVSTGGFQEALSALLGKDAPNLSASVIGRLKEEWAADHARWQRRDLSARRYVHVWADGIHLQARMEPVAECRLVIIGATPEGRKELVGFQVGVRESAQSWRELLVDLQARGLTTAPEPAGADGALGFWKALEKIFPTTRQQRCWGHKTANVLNKVAKTVQPAMKQDLREIQGPHRVARLLQLPGRTLGSHPDQQSHRKRVRHRPPPDHPHQGGALAGHRQADGLQADHRRREDVAPPAGGKPVAQGHPGRHIPRRYRGHRHRVTGRRLIRPSPNFPHSSSRHQRNPAR